MMSTHRKIYCTISVLLSLLVLGILWRFAGEEYRGMFVIPMIIIIRMNMFIFASKTGKAGN